MTNVTNPSGCRHCGIDPREHFQRWHPQTRRNEKWVEPTQDQRKRRMLERRRPLAARMLGAHLLQLRASRWACEKEDAERIEQMRDMAISLRRGECLWSVPEILLTASSARHLADQAQHAGADHARHALLFLAQDLETYLPTPSTVEQEAAQIRALVSRGRTEAALARQLRLWTQVLEAIGHGHGDASELAEAALGAYDQHTEDLILAHSDDT
ncbi:hypothetical protein [Nocardiopsis synnemataformans]|uniref:hypothetical protein n=1 Tax=Nocardiopsis synnemataformans TaxID=61305 RepID=UPI003EB9E469